MPIQIVNINETSVYIEANAGVIKELSDAFSFQVPGYKFMPAYKAGMFDGWIRLVNQREQTAPKGLVPDIVKWAIESEYDVTIDPYIVQTFKQQLGQFETEFLPSIPLPFQPRDYQVAGVQRLLDKKRQIVLLPTGAGKSLVIYLSIRVLQQLLDGQVADKILLIVPSVQLVNQMYSDFENYSSVDPNWVPEANVHKIYSGEDKTTELQVIVSTWQSIYKLGPKYFQQFGAVIGDEVHQFDGKSCTTILNKCTNAFYRLGLTGTLDGTKINEMQLKALFGPVFQGTTTSELIEAGTLSDLKIKAIVLNHPEHVRKAAKGLPYKDEGDVIVASAARNQFLTTLAGTRDGNVLLLYRFVQKHGMVLQKMIKEQFPDKQVFFIHGNVDAQFRERVRELVEKSNNAIIVASEGTFSVGVNIVNIHHVIFGHPNKSKNRVLQSIGRGLRRGKDKEKVVLYDLVDNLKYKEYRANYSLEHFLIRQQYYSEQRFDFEVKEFNLGI